MKRRSVLVAQPWLAASSISRAQSRPSKPIRLVVPFPAGGATDLLARAVAQGIGNAFGQAIVVDDRRGAGGTLGSSEVAKAAPDGHSLLVATSSTRAIGPLLPCNAEADFTPVAQVANATNIVLVPKDLPVGSIKELIAYAKARPGQLNHASSGNGTIVNLTAEAFKAQATTAE